MFKIDLLAYFNVFCILLQAFAGKKFFRAGFYRILIVCCQPNLYGSRRSIFIKGFPKNITEKTITTMLQKEGRILRVTLLKDNKGESRGMAFAEFQNPRDALKVVQNYKGKKFEGYNIFVAFKRDNNRFRNNYYPRFFNRNRNNRQFNGFRPGFNSNRFQRQMRPMRNIIRGGRGRGRGRGRGF